MKMAARRGRRAATSMMGAATMSDPISLTRIAAQTLADRGYVAQPYALRVAP